MRSSATLSLLLPLAVSASPIVDPKAANSLFCKVNNLIVTALAKDAAATTYCSSYLSIPTSTFSTTVTQTPASVTSTIPTTITGVPVTTTVSDTATNTVQETSVTTSIITEVATITLTTSTSTITCLNSAYTYTPPVGEVPAPAIAARHEPRGVAISKPTVIPAAWASSYISTACSCLSIPTPSTTKTATQTLVPGTVTVISTIIVTPTDTAFETATVTATNTVVATEASVTTATITAYAVETTIASNGVQYRKFTHPYNANLANSGFDSAFFKGAQSEFSGELNSLSFKTPNWPNGNTYLKLEDRSATFESSQSALLLQGFFIAKETGIYTLISYANDVDNYGYLWVGDAAYSSWNDANTSFKSSRTGSGSVTGTVSLTLTKGDAVPITFLWANGGGVGQNILTIKTPGGQTIVSHQGYFVQACSTSVFA